MTTIIVQASPPKKKDDELDNIENKDVNLVGRPVSPGKKVRSMNSMFAIESGYEALKQH